MLPWLKNFICLALTFFKKAILAIFYQDFGHKLQKISGNPDSGASQTE